MQSHTDEVYLAIYEKILDGTYGPGEKLHIAKLAGLFGVALSPIREALSRLIATGLVISESQRGFKVAPISKEDLQDIYTTRVLVEQAALERSIKLGDQNWEANLVAAFHRLSHIEKKIEVDSLKKYKEWEKLHREFNMALISACGLKHLLLIQEKLYQQTERYRRVWFFAGLEKGNILIFSRKQKGIMEAALARNGRKASELLEKHFEEAQKMILKSF
jgi:DNA-binding GntR family transcriptional regulator